MFSNRILSIFFLLFAFACMAYANPVDVSPSALTTRTVASLDSFASKELVARCNTGSCTCSTPGCNEGAILDILTNLKNTVTTLVGGIAGAPDQAEVIDQIVAAISQAVTLLGGVKTNVSIAGLLVVQIVTTVLSIILTLAKTVTSLPPAVAATAVGKIDFVLASLVAVLKTLIPGVIGLLTTIIGVPLAVLQGAKFVLTLVAAGLPCGC